MQAPKWLRLVVGIAALAAVTTACGAGNGGNVAMGQGGAAAAGNGQAAAAGKPPQGMPDAQAMQAGMGTDGAPVVTVVATETTCQPDTTTVRSGKVWFHMVNQGQAVNELYLETATGTEVIEVEDVMPGAGGAFNYTVQPGQMVVSCRPGMTAAKLRTPITFQ